MTPATYDQILALPEHLIGEIIDGQLIVSGIPAPRYSLATSTLLADIGRAYQRGVEGPGGWWILFQPELHLGQNVVVPDIAGWRRERMPAIPSEPFFPTAPDWICETLSPPTAIVDWTRKLDIYRKERVPSVWFLDPRMRTLEMLRLRGDAWIVAGNYGGDAKVRAVPFDAIELELAALWVPE
jgi:Uma2 family endonuclease